jgi:hypothetical protein
MPEKHSTNGNGNPERKDAVCLYRISDDGKQDTIPTQRAWGQRIAQRDGLTITGEFEEEGISGSNVNRPGLENLIAFVRERFYARDPAGLPAAARVCEALGLELRKARKPRKKPE